LIESESALPLGLTLAGALKRIVTTEATRGTINGGLLTRSVVVASDFGETGELVSLSRSLGGMAGGCTGTTCFSLEAGRGGRRSLVQAQLLGELMALGNDGIRPDAHELRIRFACGAGLGAFVGAGCAYRFGAGTPSVSALVFDIVVGGLVAGALARYFGDRFWASFRRTWPF
jgi:hypothetical protein